jgi:RNA polymerase sigma factor (sigma-70 family)
MSKIDIDFEEYARNEGFSSFKEMAAAEGIKGITLKADLRRVMRKEINLDEVPSLWLDKTEIDAIHNYSVLEDPVFELEQSQITESIFTLLASLISKKEYYILTLRFRDDKTLNVVGVLLGISPERVRQIETKALRKLRHPQNADQILKLLYMDKSDDILGGLVPKGQNEYKGHTDFFSLLAKKELAIIELAKASERVAETEKALKAARDAILEENRLIEYRQVLLREARRVVAFAATKDPARALLEERNRNAMHVIQSSQNKELFNTLKESVKTNPRLRSKAQLFNELSSFGINQNPLTGDWYRYKVYCTESQPGLFFYNVRLGIKLWIPAIPYRPPILYKMTLEDKSKCLKDNL